MSALFAGLGCFAGEITIPDFISFKGFIDTSYTYLDKEDDTAGDGNLKDTDEAFSLEEVELSILFDFESLSAQVDIEYEDGDNELDLEQAYIDYRLRGRLKGSTITAGRYASMLGFEGYEPVDLYQYSNAYGGILGEHIGRSLSGAAVDPGVAQDFDLSVFYDSIFFPVSERYSQGIRYTFETMDNFFGISFQDGTVSYDNRLRGDDGLDDMAVDDEGYSFEVAYSHDFIRIITLFLGGSYEVGEGIGSYGISVGDTQTYVLNSYVSCQLGAWLLAAEFNFSETQMDNFLDSGADAEIESVTGLIMANFAYNEQSSVTGRISYTELDADGGTGGPMSGGDTVKYTVAHNYALCENLLFVTEFSYLDGTFDANNVADGDLEEVFLAAELLFTF